MSARPSVRTRSRRSSLVGNLQNSSGTKSLDGSLTVATPQLLRVLGIRQSQIQPNADVVTSLPGFAGASGVEFTWCAKVVAIGPVGDGNFNCTKSGVLKHTVIQALGALPTGVHAPNTLITEHAIHELGITSEQIGPPIGWFVNAAEPFTAAEIHDAQAVAATANLSIETKNDEPTSATIINWATIFGIALALCILAMSVGLVRSETANDLRTLAATGASSYTRRALTAATAGALGLARGGPRHLRRLRRRHRLVARRLRERWHLRARKRARGESVGDTPWPASPGGCGRLVARRSPAAHARAPTHRVIGRRARCATFNLGRAARIASSMSLWRACL